MAEEYDVKTGQLLSKLLIAGPSRRGSALLGLIRNKLPLNILDIRMPAAECCRDISMVQFGPREL